MFFYIIPIDKNFVFVYNRCFINYGRDMETFTLDDVVKMDTRSFREFQDSIALRRWTDSYGFPAEMQKWFKEGISKHRGDDWENEFRSVCPQLLPKRNGNHDAVLCPELARNLKGDLVEIKFFTVMTQDSKKQINQRGYALTWAERATTIAVKNQRPIPPKKGTWQQVKPDCANYGIFSALYGNGAIHYWVPYHLLSRSPGKNNVESGRIPMGIQHKNHATEGQVDIKPRFHELFFLDVTIGTPFITDLSQYDLDRYDNLVF